MARQNGKMAKLPNVADSCHLNANICSTEAHALVVASQSPNVDRLQCGPSTNKMFTKYKVVLRMFTVQVLRVFYA